MIALSFSFFYNGDMSSENPVILRSLAKGIVSVSESGSKGFSYLYAASREANKK